MIKVDTAMVLAAGLGTRMRPLTDTMPKPLVPVCGTPLIDYTLNRLARAGVAKGVVNVHYFADMLEEHLAVRCVPNIVISDERETVLETGGGLLKAQKELGPAPFFCTNTDAILQDEPSEESAGEAAWSALAAHWDDACMDALLLLCPVSAASGYEGVGDFVLTQSGQVQWPETDACGGLVFTGLQLIHPRLLTGEAVRRVSTKTFWNKAMTQGRLHGIVYGGRWMHVGDPAGLAQAEEQLSGNCADGARK